MKRTGFHILQIDSIGIEKTTINSSVKSFNRAIPIIIELLGSIFSSTSVYRIYAKKI